MTLILGPFFQALCLCSALATAIGAGAAALRRREVRELRWGALAALAGAAGAVLAIEVALVRHDFSVAFVADNGSRSTPLYYTITSLWAAHDGSLLLWCLVLAGYLAVLGRRGARDPLQAWALAITAAVTAFFMALAFATGGVFERVSPIPPDGPGPTPLLADHAAMGVHPPLLYLGLVGMVVPFAYAVGALITGETGTSWLHAVRTPLRFAWTALTAGIVMGAWWSYAVLGWGGYWSWDPVENASLMPWLLATALLHSAMVQRRRRALPAWNLGLAVSTFLLAALGVLLTRSGVVASVHSFAGSGIGPVLLGFIVALVVGVLALVAVRAGRLEEGAWVGAVASRGGALVTGNIVLVAMCVTTFVGTVLPVLASALGKGQVSVGPPYYDRMVLPLMVVLLVAMALGPLLRWGSDSPARVLGRIAVPLVVGAAAGLLTRVLLPGHLGVALAVALATVVATSTVAETAPQLPHLRRRLGGRLAHLGFAVLTVGVAVSSGGAGFGEATLHAGQPTTVHGVRATLLGVHSGPQGDGTRTTATIRLSRGGTLRPALRTYTARQSTVPVPAVSARPTGDVYLTLLSTSASGRSATIRLAVNPLVDWVWLGGAMMALGGLVALRRRRARSAAAAAPAIEEVPAPVAVSRP
jgi:cytochrome c-type biogenesis protein CcmF